MNVTESTRPRPAESNVAGGGAGNGYPRDIGLRAELRGAERRAATICAGDVHVGLGMALSILRVTPAVPPV